MLTEESSGEDLQKEAEWIQRNYVNHLKRCCKKVKVCARSKRWWNKEIAENRKIMGLLKSARRRGEAMQQQVKKQRSKVRRITRQSRMKMWQDFLSSFTKDQVWQALRYSKPRGQQTMKVLKSRDGVVVESWEDKVELIKEKAFPKPLKGVERKAQEDGGGMWKTITDEGIQVALFNQSVKKAPGPDRLGFKAIRLLWEWDAPRIIAVVKMTFRLGIHPRVWKEARGVVIPKPNKLDYGVAKAYRVIMLLNCLGKVVEKVAANVIAEQYERKQNCVSEGSYFTMDSFDAEREGQR
jgi:uncharacterized protein involved in tolerance to divalent cations